MSLTQERVPTQLAADAGPPKPGRSRARRFWVRFFRGLGLVVAFVATVALAAGVAVVGPNVEEWDGILPKLDEKGYGDGASEQAADVFGWSRQQEQAGSELPEVTAEGADFAFLAPATENAPWPGHWCSTRTIGYRVDLTGVRLAGLDEATELNRWDAALNEWSTASGDRYQFEYRGEATYTLARGDQKGEMKIPEEDIPSGEIAISYATADKHAGPAWTGYKSPGLSEAYALGGIGSVRWSAGDPDSGLITTGNIVIDAGDVAPASAGLPAVYVHESGHALGLAHVENSRQVMFTNAPPHASISKGDREGIQTLAQSACPEIR